MRACEKALAGVANTVFERARSLDLSQQYDPKFPELRRDPGNWKEKSFPRTDHFLIFHPIKWVSFVLKYKPTRNGLHKFDENRGDVRPG